MRSPSILPGALLPMFRAVPTCFLCLSVAFAGAVAHGAGEQQPAGPPGTNNYALGPDSQLQAGVPRGTVTQHSWTSRIYPGTVRDYWVYVPGAVRSGHARLRDGVPGRRRVREGRRGVARAASSSTT